MSSKAQSRKSKWPKGWLRLTWIKTGDGRHRDNIAKHSITPLHWDPEQQELRTNLRPRLDLRPYEGFFDGLVGWRTLKTVKIHWIYNVFAQTCWTTLVSILFWLNWSETTMVLLCFRSNMLKQHWFYCVFAQQVWKTSGFFVCFRSIVVNKHRFYSFCKKVAFLVNLLVRNSKKRNTV